MSAPLPEVPAASQPQLSKPAPLFLSGVCALKGINFILGFALRTPSTKISPLLSWAVAAIITALMLLLMSYLWRGFNWARLVWMAIFALSLPSTLSPHKIAAQSGAYHFVFYFDLALSLILIVYLNLPAVKAHFARREPLK